ncbi:hypothetical protein ACVGVM_24350 [Pseudonocardia bannensis]|uniref:Small secreted hydrophilic protein n=1 Tax=Pseudonocardia bannensis TaxID=630973 RepID=A0A848DFX5_9PSEU|nr:hypothetical protein [Pseudonocardia bannensis]NMH91552.1 hypothetical protein [Pseudonocardia bannensis]
MQRPATWKIITVGAALSGLGLAGAGVAFADSGPGAATDIAPISVSSADPGSAPAQSGAVDLSPESADSPLESVDDSVDSPFDSPDDASPDDTPGDSPDDIPGDD